MGGEERVTVEVEWLLGAGEVEGHDDATPVVMALVDVDGVVDRHGLVVPDGRGRLATVQIEQLLMQDEHRARVMNLCGDVGDVVADG